MRQPLEPEAERHSWAFRLLGQAVVPQSLAASLTADRGSAHPSSECHPTHQRLRRSSDQEIPGGNAGGQPSGNSQGPPPGNSQGPHCSGSHSPRGLEEVTMVAEGSETVVTAVEVIRAQSHAMARPARNLKDNSWATLSSESRRILVIRKRKSTSH